MDQYKKYKKKISGKLSITKQLPYNIPYAEIVHNFPGYLRHLKMIENKKLFYDPQASMRKKIDGIFGENFYDTKVLKSSAPIPAKSTKYNPADKWPDVDDKLWTVNAGYVWVGPIKRIILPFEENKVRNNTSALKQNINPYWDDISDQERIPESEQIPLNKKELVIYGSANSRNVGNMKASAMKKHRGQRFGREQMAASSVSLPNWNAARLNMAKKILAGRNVHLSRTEIIMGCMKAYLPKLRLESGSRSIRDNHTHRSKEYLGPLGDGNLRRTRLQNERGTYKYKKISIYCDFDDWDRLQQRCYHARISLSHAADIALRLYLRAFVEQLLLSGVQKDRMKNKLLNFGKYQRKVMHKKVHQLEIRYFFDSGPKNPYKQRRSG